MVQNEHTAKGSGPLALWVDMPSVRAEVVSYPKFDTSKKIFPYFTKGNNFPNEWMSAVLDSGTATACVETIADFIFGDGFTDPQIGKVIVNAKTGETLSDLTLKLCRDFAFFRGFGINVRHSEAGLPYLYDHIPFQNIRKGRRDGEDSLPLFYFRQNWAKQKAKDNKEYAYTPFNPKAGLAMINNESFQLGEGNYFGQLMYFYMHTPGAETYPIPRGYSEFNLIRAEAEFSSYQYHNIANNFLFSTILSMPGVDLDARYGDEKKTVREGLKEQLEEGRGSTEAGKILILGTEVKVDAFPNSTTPEMFNTVQELITDKITRAFGVPGILANIQTSGKLGQAQEFVNATQYFQNNLINVMQRKMEEKLRELFTNFKPLAGKEIKFKNKKLLDYIPSEVYAKLTDDEIRQLAGFGPAAKNDVDVQKTLNGAQVTSLIEVVSSAANGYIPVESAKQMLVIAFALTPEQAENVLATVGKGFMPKQQL